MIDTAPTTEQVAEAALAGDEEALGRLLATLQPAAYATAYRVLGSEADAADVVQEACLLAVRAIRREDARPRGPEYFGAWFRRIVTNAALQRLRRRPRMAAVPVDDLIEQLPAHNGEEPAEEAERREVRGHVLRALLALPDAQRAALTLREFEELSYDEIAEALGATRLSVQMLLFRARRNFRSAYEGVIAHPGTVGCPQLAPLLSGLLDGEIGGKGWLTLSVHLSHCAHCRTELAELRKTRKIAALIPLIPLPGLRDVTAPASAGTVAQAATLAPIAPGLVEGVLHLGPAAWTAAGVVALGLGVAVGTSVYVGGPPHVAADEPREIVIDASAAGREALAFAVDAEETATIPVDDRHDAAAADPGPSSSAEAPEAIAAASPEGGLAYVAGGEGADAEAQSARVPLGSSETRLLAPVRPDDGRSGPAPPSAGGPDQAAALQLGPATMPEVDLPAVPPGADPAVPDMPTPPLGSIPPLPAPVPTAVVEEVIDRVTGLPATAVPAVATAVTDVADAVPTVVGQATAVVPTVTALAGQAGDDVQGAVPTLATVAGQGADSVQGAVPTIAAAATQVGAVSPLGGTVPTVAAAATQVAGGMPTAAPMGGGGTLPVAPQPTATPRPTTAPAAPIPPTLPPTPIPLPTVPPPPTVPLLSLPLRP